MRRWRYFDRNNMSPKPNDLTKPTDDELQKIDKWDYKDQVACYLLSQHLPDTTAIRLSSYTTAATRWSRVNDEYTAKSVYA